MEAEEEKGGKRRSWKKSDSCSAGSMVDCPQAEWVGPAPPLVAPPSAGTPSMVPYTYPWPVPLTSLSWRALPSSGGPLSAKTSAHTVPLYAKNLPSVVSINVPSTGTLTHTRTHHTSVYMAIVLYILKIGGTWIESNCVIHF